MVRPALLAAALAAAVIAPASAQATLVFDRHPLKPSIYVAGNDGAGARRLASGSQPHISPDGASVAYMVTGDPRTYRPDLMVVPADGSAPPRVLAKRWRESFTFAWSPDSRTIAALVGPELGQRSLALIDVATGVRRTVARGYFSGVSFSPAGDQILFARSPDERYPVHSDVFRANVVDDGTPPVPITSDHVSQSPLWGPNGRVVYVRLVDAANRRYGPKNELYTMAPDGSAPTRLTKTSVAPLLQGLVPTAWSADGTKLLTQFGGQDTSYAVKVDPLTGAQQPLRRAAESGLIGTDLTADGRTVLGATGGFDPDDRHDVVAVPFAGGKARVLARNAFDPDWNR